MGYDVELVQIAVTPKQTFPIAPEVARALLAETAPFEDLAFLEEQLLAIDGARPGPDDAIDYLGAGLNYARFFPRERSIHIDNNLNAKELLKVYEALCTQWPTLLIHDLQSGKLHNAESFRQWWSRPL